MQECEVSVGYTAASTRPCNNFQCFSDADCSGQGRCDSDSKTCSCDSNYAGPSCSISLGPCNASSSSAAPAPTSPTAGLLQLCCPSGVVDHVGRCCASGESETFRDTFLDGTTACKVRLTKCFPCRRCRWFGGMPPDGFGSGQRRGVLPRRQEAGRVRSVRRRRKGRRLPRQVLCR